MSCCNGTSLRKKVIPAPFVLNLEQDAESTHEFLVNGTKDGESLDYPIVYNALRLEEQRKSKVRSRRMDASFRWLLALCTGLMVGVVGFVLHYCTDNIFKWKFGLANRFLAAHNMGSAFGNFFATNLALALFGSLLITFVPPAGGAGTTEVVAYLNGNRLSAAVSIKTFFFKLITSICHVSSSLPVGPEGPMIMLGAICGGSFAYSHSKMLGLKFPCLQPFHNDKDRRDFISIGAACGVAAAFNAPIGGILFSLEECSSFWSPTLTAQSFLGAMAAVFVANYLVHHNEMKGSDWQASYGAAVFENLTFVDLLFASAIGSCGGLLGALFVKLSAAAFVFRKKYIFKSRWRRLIEVSFWVLIVSSLLFVIPLINGCHARPAPPDMANEGSPKIEAEYVEDSRWTCRAPVDFDSTPTNSTTNPDDGGQVGEMYNAYAGIFFTASPDQLKRFFAGETWNDFSGGLLLLFLAFFWLFTCLAAGSTISGGLLVPSLVIGASLGRLMIWILHALFPKLMLQQRVPIYAIVGAAAFLAGTSRLKLSLTIIMLEITHSLSTLPALMLSVMFANWVGDMFGHSLQHKQLHLRGITFLDSEPPHALEMLHVMDLMSRDVKYFPLRPTVQSILRTLMKCKHNGFPVVDVGANGEARRLRGLILRSQLAVLLHKRVWREADPDKAFNAAEMAAHVAHVPMGPDRPIRLNVTPADEAATINLEPFINESCCSVPLRFSASVAFRLFRGMGLRHLPVVDTEFNVVGMLTRKDMFSHAVHVVEQWEQRSRLSRRPSIIA